MARIKRARNGSGAASLLLLALLAATAATSSAARELRLRVRRGTLVAGCTWRRPRAEHEAAAMQPEWRHAQAPPAVTRAHPTVASSRPPMQGQPRALQSACSTRLMFHNTCAGEVRVAVHVLLADRDGMDASYCNNGVTLPNDPASSVEGAWAR